MFCYFKSLPWLAIESGYQNCQIIGISFARNIMIQKYVVCDAILTLSVESQSNLNIDSAE
jgi:hypothetical protein